MLSLLLLLVLYKKRGGVRRKKKEKSISRMLPNEWRAALRKKNVGAGKKGGKKKKIEIDGKALCT